MDTTYLTNGNYKPCKAELGYGYFENKENFIKFSTRRYIKCKDDYLDEIYCLKKLEKYNCAPKIIEYDEDKLLLVTTKIKLNNVPLKEIINDDFKIYEFAKIMYEFENNLANEAISYHDWKLSHLFLDEKNNKLIVVDYDHVDCERKNDGILSKIDEIERIKNLYKQRTKEKYEFLNKINYLNCSSFKEFKKDLESLIK